MQDAKMPEGQWVKGAPMTLVEKTGIVRHVELSRVVHSEVAHAAPPYADHVDTGQPRPSLSVPATPRAEAQQKETVQLANNAEDAQLIGAMVEHFVSTAPLYEEPESFIRNVLSLVFSSVVQKIRKSTFIGWTNKARIDELNTILASTKLNETQRERYTSELQQRKSEEGKNAERARKTRNNLRTVGAELKTIETKDGASLDAAYISADRFLEKLKANGAERGTVQTAQGTNIYGFVFGKNDFEGKEKSLLQALFDLGMVSLSSAESNPGKVYDWGRVELGEKIFVAPIEEILELSKLPAEERNHLGLAMQTRPIDSVGEKARGTLILTGGANSVYEAHKREIMSFLARGLNVMAFNFRGYGESTGTPDGQGVKRDMDAVYDYLQSVHPVDDKDLIIKSICMSGAAGTHLAAQHPEANLLLDQTYSDFGDFVEREARNELEGLNLPLGFLNTVAKYVGSQIARLLAPSWVLRDEIGTVNGRVGILFAEDDVRVPLEDVVKNIEAMLLNGKSNVTVYRMDGEHGKNWRKSRSEPVERLLGAVQYFPKEPQGRLQQELAALVRHLASLQDNGTLSDADKVALLKQIQARTRDILDGGIDDLNAKKDLQILYRHSGEVIDGLQQQLPNADSSFLGKAAVDNFLDRTGHLKPLSASK